MKQSILAVLLSAVTILISTALHAYDNQPYCREYTETIKIGNELHEGYGTACMQPDGSWQKVTDVTLAGQPAVQQPISIYNQAPPQQVIIREEVVTRPLFHLSLGDNHWRRHHHHYRKPYRKHRSSYSFVKRSHNYEKSHHHRKSAHKHHRKHNKHVSRSHHKHRDAKKASRITHKVRKRQHAAKHGKQHHSKHVQKAHHGKQHASRW